MLRLLLACNWLLLLMILTLADRSESADAGALGAVGLLKVGSRLLIVGLLGYLAVHAWSEDRRAAVVWRLLPWWCFALWALASTLWSPLWSLTFGQSISLLILMTLSFCTAMHVRRMAEVSLLLKHLCLALLMLSTVLVAARYLMPDAMSLTRLAKGLFHPTNAASSAGLGIVLIVGSRLIFAWDWSRWLIWPSLAAHGATLFLASNRASLMITLVTVCGIGLLYGSHIWRWLLLTAGSFVCAAYVTLDPGFHAIDQAAGGLGTYLARDQSAQQLAELSGREEMWAAMWDSYLNSPWRGHGYFVCSETGQLKVWHEWSNWTAHNFWLQALVGTGVIGAALLAWGMIAYGLGIAASRNRSVGLSKLIFLGAAVLLWQIVWGLTNESFVGPLQSESVVFFVALGLVTGRQVRVDTFSDHATRLTYHEAPLSLNTRVRYGIQ